MGCGGSTAAEPANTGNKHAAEEKQELKEQKPEPVKATEGKKSSPPPAPSEDNSPKKEPEVKSEAVEEDAEQEGSLDDYKKLAEMSVNNIMAGAMSNLDNLDSTENDERNH